jgi:RsiW-degrading membrane proteinase PrsW (M82 family)
MKVLTTVFNETEAKMLVSYFKASGIQAESEGAKEYASIITGTAQGRYRIYVEEADLAAAENLLKKIQQNHLSVAYETPTIPNYFKRAIVMAVLATIVIPIVFNIASLLNAKKYWESSNQDSQTKFKLILIFLFQIPALFSAYFIFKSFL